MKQNAAPASCSKKKGRKRKKSGDVAASKIVVNDKLPTPWRKLHHLGEPMLPAHYVNKLTPDMRSVHDAILTKEKLLLKDRNPSYPILIAKVPTGFGFVNTYPADLIFIRYEDIFRLLHMQQLDRSLVRLISLSMAHDIAMENTTHIAIMDPYYMTPTVAQTEQAFLANYIKNFLVLNKDKSCFVIPYFRDFKYCTLLLFYPYHSDVTYLDSGLDKEKDFTDLKSTLDKALSGFIAEVGVNKLRHEKKVKGCHVCNHITKFPCLKQSADDNGMEAWFAILQMRAVVRSQNDLLLPSALQGKFVNMADTTDENMTYYVVYHGRVPGVYEDWEDCRRQVHRFSGNSYKGERLQRPLPLDPFLPAHLFPPADVYCLTSLRPRPPTSSVTLAPATHWLWMPPAPPSRAFPAYKRPRPCSLFSPHPTTSPTSLSPRKKRQSAPLVAARRHGRHHGWSPRGGGEKHARHGPVSPSPSLARRSPSSPRPNTRLCAAQVRREPPPSSSVREPLRGRNRREELLEEEKELPSAPRDGPTSPPPRPAAASNRCVPAGKPRPPRLLSRPPA
ncbi:hypothetical protein QYE76_048868 [Lolium multiflorum]|uniref:Ribonuclease H1 N-terminal domain-containing protein n=1 Tax=Lolium multiflorum TaxID=4521 RepID=A0AAD8SN62_LOLMU|nr:hypothetical protein QYE76_048868 [Lolium multiflorum]